MTLAEILTALEMWLLLALIVAWLGCRAATCLAEPRSFVVTEAELEELLLLAPRTDTLAAEGSLWEAVHIYPDEPRPAPPARSALSVPSAGRSPHH